jgi:hypothetical protein
MRDFRYAVLAVFACLVIASPSAAQTASTSTKTGTIKPVKGGGPVIDPHPKPGGPRDIVVDDGMFRALRDTTVGRADR